MIMIRDGENRQGACPLKYLTEVWRHPMTSYRPPPTAGRSFYSVHDCLGKLRLRAARPHEPIRCWCTRLPLLLLLLLLLLRRRVILHPTAPCLPLPSPPPPHTPVIARLWASCPSLPPDTMSVSARSLGCRTHWVTELADAGCTRLGLVLGDCVNGMKPSCCGGGVNVPTERRDCVLCVPSARVSLYWMSSCTMAERPSSLPAPRGARLLNSGALRSDFSSAVRRSTPPVAGVRKRRDCDTNCAAAACYAALGNVSCTGRSPVLSADSTQTPVLDAALHR